MGPYSRGLYEAYTQGHGTSPVHRAGIAGPHTREQGRAQPHSTRPQGHRQARRAGHTARPGSRTHPATTLAARTAQGSQGTKASSAPASDERCDSMHHLHVV